MKKQIIIYIATIQDVQKLNELAFASKASWGYPKHYLKIWKNEIMVDIELIQKNRIYKAIDDKNTLVGFYGLKGDPPMLELEGFWIKPEEMGKGIGKMLFQHMRQEACFLKAQFVRWDSDPNACPFYLHMKAKQVGKKEYMLDGKKRVLPIMELKL